MRKIVLNLAVTLDGFIEGPNGEIDWLDTGSYNEMGDGSPFEKFMNSIDTIFYGRISYNKWGQYQPEGNASTEEKKIWESVHSKNKYVFSKNAVPDGRATYINSVSPNKIQEIKSLPGKDIWLYGGAGLITSFMNEGLVDAYSLAVYPVILGEGKPLFTGIQNKVGLQLRTVTASPSGVVLMEYDKT